MVGERRLSYLRAMGIDVWEPRRAAPASGGLGAEAPESAPAPVVLAPVAPSPPVSAAPVPPAPVPSDQVPSDQVPSDPVSSGLASPDLGSTDLATTAALEGGLDFGAGQGGASLLSSRPPAMAGGAAGGAVGGGGSSRDTAPDGPGSHEPGPHGLDWTALAEAVAGCRACGLCETRTQTVFGIGDRQADLMLIGEAPGADEDREGEPFVGSAGQLLNRMLAALGLGRGQVYIANILKCRPPGNRDPRPEETARCEAFLQRQIALVQPRVILALGRVAAQQLLSTDVSVGRLRGRWHSLGPSAIPLRVTYHPAYLLRSPEQKGKAWADLCAVAQRLS